MNRKYLFLLCFIVILGGILRFISLSTMPPSLSHDEVAIGYNGWSIYQIGKDEYGTTFPPLFRSFDDYKLPGYIYFTALSQAVFGMNAFAVRFPSAFLGTLTILCLYFLIHYMTPRKELRILSHHVPAYYFALLSSCLLAVSPWHINFSRAAFESNASVFFIVLGSMFLFASRRKKWLLICSSLAFVASLYFYYTARLLVPVILLSYVLAYRGEVVKNGKMIMVSLFLGLIALLPILPNMLTSGTARVNQVSIFESDIVRVPYWEAIVRSGFSIDAKVFYSKYVAYGVHFADNYLKNFNFDYFFANGTGSMGLLYLWELPFFLIGIFFLFQVKDPWRWFVVMWFLSVPIVGGLTVGQPNALRTLPNVIPTSIFTAYGLLIAWAWIKTSRFFLFFYAGFFGVILFFFFRFLSLYFMYMPYETADRWGDGHRQLAEYIVQHGNNFDHIYITGANWRPYIYLLYYMKYPPGEYIKGGSRFGFSHITFGSADWDKEDLKFSQNPDLSKLEGEKKLIVLTPQEYEMQMNSIRQGNVPYSLRTLKEINGIYIKPRFLAVTILQEAN